MKNNTLIQKILIVILIFNLLLALFCTTTFAGEVTVQVSESETTTINFNDNISCYKYITIMYKDIGDYNYSAGGYSHQYYIFLSDEPIIFDTNYEHTNGSTYGYFIHTNSTNAYYRQYRVISDKKTKDFENVLKPVFETLDISQFTTFGFLGTDSAFSSTDIYASNHNITDSEGNLVFQVAPLMPEIPEITSTLVEQTTQTQIQEQMKMTILGFLKYLIALVISVIAFWKGWKFLSKQFKTA